MNVTRLRGVDSHTGGEPTRVIVEGFPDLGSGTMSDRLEVFHRSFDHLRAGIVREPRGHNAMVGALLCEAHDPDAAVGVIFFNNVGYLGMCGHGSIGVIKTLEYMGRITTGDYTIETPVGNVVTTLHEDGWVSITNVPSYRYAKDVVFEVPEYGRVTGDISYGGNWFFLIGEHPFDIELSNLKALTDFTVAVRKSLSANGIYGADGADIDHVELFAPSSAANSRNFVLCPGMEYDRSPCGTGTSAKLACLYADGHLNEGTVWRQESIGGSIFEGRVITDGDKIIPVIRGTAYVTAEFELTFDPKDPYRFGIGG